MKAIKRLAVILAVFCAVILLFSSCAEILAQISTQNSNSQNSASTSDTDNNTTSDTTVSTTTTTTATTPENSQTNSSYNTSASTTDEGIELPEINLGGKKINIWTIPGSGDFSPQNIDDSLAQSLFQRNMIVEYTLNCTVETVSYDKNSFQSKLLNDFYSGALSTKDIITETPGNAAFSLMQTGIYQDLSSIDTLGLKEYYFSPDVNKAFIIGSSQYLISGRFSMSFYRSVFFAFYNKQLFEDFNISILDTVADGKWDLEKLNQITNLLYNDIDGDGVVGENDIFGLSINKNHAVVVSDIIGQRFIGKDGWNYYELNPFNENTISNFDKFCSIRPVFKSTNTITTFKNGKTGMTISTPRSLGNMADYNFDLGVLPLPKASVDSPDYTSTVLADAPVYGMPRLQTGKNLEDMAIFLEYFAAISDFYLTGVFYDMMLGDSENFLEFACLEAAVNKITVDPIFILIPEMSNHLKSPYFEDGPLLSTMAMLSQNIMIVIDTFNSEMRNINQKMVCNKAFYYRPFLFIPFLIKIINNPSAF